MKFKFIIFAVVLALVSFANTFGQDLNFDFQISLNQNIFWAKNNKILAKVVITNKSNQILNTAKFGGIRFYLSKCPKDADSLIGCNTRGDKYISSVEVKSKFLKKDESLEFEVNLADLYWQDMISSYFDFSYPKNLNKVPILNKHFYAEVGVFEKYIEIKESHEKIPISKKYQSNEIIQKVKP